MQIAMTKVTGQDHGAVMRAGFGFSGKGGFPCGCCHRIAEREWPRAEGDPS